MQTFYFDLWNGQQVDFDDTGLELPGLEAAFEEAILGARDMLRDAKLRRQDVSGWAYQVRGESGKALFTVTLSLAAADPHYARAWRVL